MPNFERQPLNPRTRVERIVGGTELHQEAALEIHLEGVDEYRAKNLENEREKTAEELQMIAVAATNINNLRSKYKLAPIPITPEQVRTISDKEHTVGDAVIITAGGYDSLNQQTILTDAEELAKSGIGRFCIIQHELLHSTQYQALQIRGENNNILTGYRVGLQTEPRNPDTTTGEYKHYLLPLNEAVTEENSRRLVLSTSTDEPGVGPLLTKRNEQFEEFKEFCQNTPNHGYPEALLAGDVRQSKMNPETGRPTVNSFGYYHERQAMWKLFDKIYEKNPAAFPNKTAAEAREEIFDMVTKASFDGNIMPFGRLMNDTFGLGTFRDFGHLQTAQDIVNFVESLETGNDSK